MFGGHGIYHQDVFFAIVYEGRLYFKTTPATRPSYEKEGMMAFRPSAKQTLKNYFEVPPHLWAPLTHSSHGPGRPWPFLPAPKMSNKIFFCSWDRGKVWYLSVKNQWVI